MPSWKMGDTWLKTLFVVVVAAAATAPGLGSGMVLEARQQNNSELFSGQFCDYTSFQAGIVDNRLMLFGGNLTVNKGSSTKEKREIESGFQFFSIFLNDTFSTAGSVNAYLKREADPAAQKRVASMRDGSAFSHNGEIYYFGGEQLFNAGEGNSIWKCTPTSERIVWDPATLDDGVNRLVTKGASLNVPGENKGFYFGGQGLEAKGADSGQADKVLADTRRNDLVVVSFSDDKQEYKNVTASASKVKPLAQSNLLFVPAGKEGLLVSLGGNDGSGGGAWDTLQVYDIASESWYNQQTLGNLTSGRSQHPGSGTCSVIRSDADGKSHYIYVYGGSNRAPGQSQLAILTIPAFEWFTINNDNFPSKVDAQCELVGERQMLVVGGRSSDGSRDCGVNNFLEIVDISELQIVTSFPNSSPFTAPGLLQTASNSSSPAGGWTDPNLQSAYETQYQNAARRQASSKSDKGAIIGGVVGGVAGIVIIGLVALYFIMRNHRKKNRKEVREAVSEVKRESGAAQPFLAQSSPGFPSPGYSQGYHSPGYPPSGYPHSGYPQTSPGFAPTPTFAPAPAYKDNLVPVEAPGAFAQAPAELPPAAPTTKPAELPS